MASPRPARQARQRAAAVLPAGCRPTPAGAPDKRASVLAVPVRQALRASSASSPSCPLPPSFPRGRSDHRDFGWLVRRGPDHQRVPSRRSVRRHPRRVASLTDWRGRIGPWTSSVLVGGASWSGRRNHRAVRMRPTCAAEWVRRRSRSLRRRTALRSRSGALLWPPRCPASHCPQPPLLITAVYAHRDPSRRPPQRIDLFDASPPAPPMASARSLPTASAAPIHQRATRSDATSPYAVLLLSPFPSPSLLPPTTPPNHSPPPHTPSRHLAGRSRNRADSSRAAPAARNVNRPGQAGCPGQWRGTGTDAVFVAEKLAFDLPGPASQSGFPGQRSSRMVAFAWPPPSHMVCSP